MNTGGEVLGGGVSRNRLILSQAPDIVIDRPNDVTGYVTGDVWGPAGGDCRIALGIPPVAGASLIAVAVRALNNRPVGDPALTLRFFLFNEQPATILADNAPIALSDADIARIAMISNNALSAQLAFAGGGGGTDALNMGAGANGRRGAMALLVGSTIGGTVPVGVPTPTHAYFALGAAYAPLALERTTLTFVGVFLSTLAGAA